jgi:cytidine deaminase
MSSRVPATSSQMPSCFAVASDIRDRAYAPYSELHVGAAVRASDRTVYAGVNVENRSLGLTLCAERVAIAQAVAAGARELTELALAGPHPTFRPCGGCLQFLSEFATRITLVTFSYEGCLVSRPLTELLPLWVPPADD